MYQSFELFFFIFHFQAHLGGKTENPRYLRRAQPARHARHPGCDCWSSDCFLCNKRHLWRRVNKSFFCYCGYEQLTHAECTQHLVPITALNIYIFKDRTAEYSSQLLCLARKTLVRLEFPHFSVPGDNFCESPTAGGRAILDNITFDSSGRS